jgi:uncharacterized Zn finger protein
MSFLRVTDMEIVFACDCGEDISEFTRGGTTKNAKLECMDCGAVWTVTLTNIRDGNPEP